MSVARKRGWCRLVEEVEVAALVDVDGRLGLGDGRHRFFQPLEQHRVAVAVEEVEVERVDVVAVGAVAQRQLLGRVALLERRQFGVVAQVEHQRYAVHGGADAAPVVLSFPRTPIVFISFQSPLTLTTVPHFSSFPSTPVLDEGGFSFPSPSFSGLLFGFEGRVLSVYLVGDFGVADPQHDAVGTEAVAVGVGSGQHFRQQGPLRLHLIVDHCLLRLLPLLPLLLHLDFEDKPARVGHARSVAVSPGCNLPCTRQRTCNT